MIDSTSGCSTKNFRDRRRLLRRDDKIEIAHDFLPAPITSRQIDLERIGMGGQIAAQRFRFRRDLPKLK